MRQEQGPKKGQDTQQENRLVGDEATPDDKMETRQRLRKPETEHLVK